MRQLQGQVREFPATLAAVQQRAASEVSPAVRPDADYTARPAAGDAGRAAVAHEGQVGAQGLGARGLQRRPRHAAGVQGLFIAMLPHDFAPIVTSSLLTLPPDLISDLSFLTSHF